MNVFLLVVALAAPVEAPKAGLQEAAAANAAVAFEAVLPTVDAVCGAETAPPQVGVISEVETTPPQTGDLWGGGVSPAPNVEAAIPPRISAYPEARSDFDYNLCEVFRRRPLSGPWSITRRLNAASIRGDEGELERLTALLENAVGEALEAEGTGQGRVD